MTPEGKRLPDLLTLSRFLVCRGRLPVSVWRGVDVSDSQVELEVQPLPSQRVALLAIVAAPKSLSRV
jgi:hypothetical protein